jgi:hypothetical protein
MSRDEQERFAIAIANVLPAKHRMMDIARYSSDRLKRKEGPL